MDAADLIIQRRLRAADRGRELARRASARAARATRPDLADRFEREADVHLAAVDCFLSAARAASDARAFEIALSRRARDRTV